MKSLIPIIVSIFLICPCYAQPHKVNNPEALIMKQYDSIQYSDIRQTGSGEKLKKLVFQSEKLNYKPGILKGLILLQSHMTRQGSYELSEKYGDQAEAIASIDKDYHSLSLIALNRANTAIGLGLLSEAKEVIYKNKSNTDKISNKADKAKNIANSYMMLSGIYSRLKKNDSVIYFAKKNLDILKTVPEQELTNLQKAKYYHTYIYQLMNMAIIYMEKSSPSNPALAESYIKKAIKFSETHPQYFKLCDIEVYETASYVYLKKEQYDKSIFFAQKALEIEKTKRKPEERLAAYSDLKDSYKALHNDTEELKYLNLYTKLSDSLNQSQKNTIINQSRREISHLKDESTYNTKILLGFSIVILFVFCGMWGLNIKKNREFNAKYNQIVTTLKNQNQIQEPEQNIEKERTTASNNTIYSETEIKLLKKLTAFESSDKFLKPEISLNYLASQFKTNATYLSHMINHHKSRNFNSYINSLRINYITYKLYNDKKYREYKVVYLAKECGYASSKVFVNAFKNEHGVTPSYFIDKLKKDNE